MTIKSVTYIDESNIRVRVQVTTGINRKMLKSNSLKSTITQHPGNVCKGSYIYTEIQRQENNNTQ
jgi:hypothetical protein